MVVCVCFSHTEVGPETFLTVDEAAQRLRMNPATLRRQLRAGRIAAVRTGKLWRIPESALEPVSATGQRFASVTGEADAAELEALFAPPSPAEIAARLRAWENFGRAPIQRATPLDLSAEADPYGYEERADRIMGGDL